MGAFLGFFGGVLLRGKGAARFYTFNTFRPPPHLVWAALAACRGRNWWFTSVLLRMISETCAISPGIRRVRHAILVRRQ